MIVLLSTITFGASDLAAEADQDLVARADISSRTVRVDRWTSYSILIDNRTSETIAVANLQLVPDLETFETVLPNISVGRSVVLEAGDSVMLSGLFRLREPQQVQLDAVITWRSVGGASGEARSVKCELPSITGFDSTAPSSGWVQWVGYSLLASLLALLVLRHRALARRAEQARIEATTAFSVVFLLLFFFAAAAGLWRASASTISVGIVAGVLSLTLFLIEDTTIISLIPRLRSVGSLEFYQATYHEERKIEIEGRKQYFQVQTSSAKTIGSWMAQGMPAIVARGRLRLLHAEVLLLRTPAGEASISGLKLPPDIDQSCSGIRQLLDAYRRLADSKDPVMRSAAEEVCGAGEQLHELTLIKETWLEEFRGAPPEGSPERRKRLEQLVLELDQWLTGSIETPRTPYPSYLRVMLAASRHEAERALALAYECRARFPSSDAATVCLAQTIGDLAKDYRSSALYYLRGIRLMGCPESATRRLFAETRSLLRERQSLSGIEGLASRLDDLRWSFRDRLLKYATVSHCDVMNNAANAISLAQLEEFETDARGFVAEILEHDPADPYYLDTAGYVDLAFGAKHQDRDAVARSIKSFRKALRIAEDMGYEALVQAISDHLEVAEKMRAWPRPPGE